MDISTGVVIAIAVPTIPVVWSYAMLKGRFNTHERQDTERFSNVEKVLKEIKDAQIESNRDIKDILKRL